jgi:hypothetical protein
MRMVKGMTQEALADEYANREIEPEI